MIIGFQALPQPPLCLEQLGVKGLAQGSNFEINVLTLGFELTTFRSQPQNHNPLNYTTVMRGQLFIASLSKCISYMSVVQTEDFI